MKKREYIIIFLFALLFVFLIKFSYNYYNKYKESEAKLIQNELAFNDSLKIIKKGNEEIYHKYIFYRNLDSLKSLNILKKEKEILQYQKTIVKLNSIISEKKYDSVLVSNDTTYFFSDSTSFYQYSLKIKLPYHFLNLQFFPFSLTTYITKNENGIISAYVKVPDSLKEFIKINEVEVVFDNFENKEKIEKINNFSLSGFTAYANENIYFGLGVHYKNFYLLGGTSSFKTFNYKNIFFTVGYKFLFL